MTKNKETLGDKSQGQIEPEPQAALFDVEERGGIDVLCSRFIESRSMDYKQLFDGFDHLRVITFSYGLGFLSAISDFFKDVEVVLGSTVTIRPDIIDVAIHQCRDMRRLSRQKRLVERVKDGTVSIYFNTRRMSHEKLYLLSSDDGRCRVIIGSANLSKRAFTGGQAEEIVCFDNDPAIYENRMSRFMELREQSTVCPLEPAALASFVEAGGDKQKQIESTPVSSKHGVVYLVDDPESDEEPDTIYTYDPKDMTEEQLEAMRAIKPRTTKVDGLTVITADEVRRVVRAGREGVKRHVVKALAYPSFRYDTRTNTAYLNDRPYPTAEGGEWVADAHRIAQIMRGYDAFVGDVEVTKQQLFKVLAFMFTAPFMGHARQAAIRGNYSRWPFPNYCILYGDSNAGKSTFVKMCLQAMYGSVQTGIVTNDQWTKTGIRYIDQMCEGMCVVFNDPDPGKFKSNMRRIIVDDEDRGNDESAASRPIYVVTVNKVTALPPEYAKRSVLVRTEARIDRETGIEDEKALNDSIDSLTTAFFLEYLTRMLPLVTQMEDRSRASESDEDERGWKPDLLRLSCETLHDMFYEAGMAAPWNASLDYGDFIGETATARVARDKLIEAYHVDDSQFRVRRGTNSVEYRPSGVEGDRAARYETKAIYEELPAYLEARLVNNVIVFKNVRALENFLGVTLDKSLRARLRRVMDRVRSSD